MLAIAASYAAWFATSVSEAFVLIVWGGAWLVLAHQARPRTAAVHPPPDRGILVRPAMSDRATTSGSIRLQPGL